MPHADAVEDGLVGGGDAVVGGIDGCRRAGAVRESDPDTDGTRDARRKVGPVEVGALSLMACSNNEL